MRAEAMEGAETSLGKYADLARNAAGIEPEQVIREGARADEIVKLIDEDEDIAVLVLAAGTDKEGPVNIGVAVLSPSEDKLLLITYWGTKGKQDAHDDELIAISSSLKPAG